VPDDPGGRPEEKALLTILPGNYSGPITVINAQLVGNYALKIEWSDQHDSGIYPLNTSAKFVRRPLGLIRSRTEIASFDDPWR
jgi:hypothetical protein